MLIIHGDYYMFIFRRNEKESSKVILARAKTIKTDTDQVLFCFSYDHSSFEEYIKASDIIAAEDQKGRVEVEGCTRKFKIINQQLFDQCVADQIINLKRE